ncbi:MAG: hypothetical protein IKP83_01995 [Bacteroidales bacterium]|nr:hypothetical protein [Bacteroidales bacterium]
MNRYLVIVFLLLSAISLRAQRDDFLSRSELLLMGGGMNYIGDLNKQSAFSEVNLAGGAALRVRLDNRWALRGQVSYGHIANSRDRIILRNLSFRSHVAEFSALAEFNFQSFGAGATDHFCTPYLFGGIGVFHFDPMAYCTDVDGNVGWVPLQPLGTEGQNTHAYAFRRPYQLVQLCLPFGVGVKFRLNKTFSLSAEYGFRKTWTDYLDDVSTTYVGAALLNDGSVDGAMAAQLADRSGEVEAGYVNSPGIKRGDDSLDDWYAYFNIHVGLNLDVLFGWMRSKRCKL